MYIQAMPWIKYRCKAMTYSNKKFSKSKKCNDNTVKKKTVAEKAGHICLLGNGRNFMTEAVVTQFYFFFGGVYLNLMLMYGFPG